EGVNLMKSQPEAKFVRGTPLDEKALKHGTTFSVTYLPKLRYAWDTGEAIGRYLAELKEGRLIARACRKCERVMITTRMFCERCFRPTDEWVYVKDTGKIFTFSLCYVSWDVRRLKQPEILAVIEIDGASPGMGILHVVKTIAPANARGGMPARAAGKPQ